jgi:hypothetical protein
MKKIIVSTTINPPTKAIKLFDQLEDYELIVIGDRKTPTNYKLNKGRYFGPEEQHNKYKKLSDLIGWDCIQRRNIGFLIALELGADVIATVDDDNIPLTGWGNNSFIGKTEKVKKYIVDDFVFDPIGATNYSTLWHRGFPIQKVAERDYLN